MRGFVIRRADPSDVAQLVALEREAFGDRSWGAGGVSDGFNAPGVEMLLCARAAEPPSGFAIWRALPGEAELLSIGVATGERRSGAGSALLDAVLTAAANARAAAIFLEVDPENIAAVTLYARAGFEEAARRKAYYRSGADAVIMRKPL